MKLQINVNTKGTNKKIKKLLESFNLQRPIEDSLALLKDEAELNIEQQGAIYAGKGFIRSGGAFANNSKATTIAPPWKPLSEKTKKQRSYLIKKGKLSGITPSRPILVRNGNLRRGFRTKRESNLSGIVTNIVSYALVHQYGTISKNIPQRPILGISRKSVLAIKIIFKNHLEKYKI